MVIKVISQSCLLKIGYQQTYDKSGFKLKRRISDVIYDAIKKIISLKLF